MRPALAIFAILVLCSGAESKQRRRATHYRVAATAFSTHGTTKAGNRTHTGIVAADPRVFPLGTRIRVTGAGRFDGIYVVTDTGDKINGREIDIFIPNRQAAKRFGKKMVRVRVLKWGNLEPNELARK